MVWHHEGLNNETCLMVWHHEGPTHCLRFVRWCDGKKNIEIISVSFFVQKDIQESNNV
jgi:hypothetical protein